MCGARWNFAHGHNKLGELASIPFTVHRCSIAGLSSFVILDT